MAKIEEQVTNLINEQVLKNGYEIYDLEYIKEGNEYYLRIFIEKPEGNITLEDCVVYTHEGSEELWVRPLSMFTSLVDKEKYPDVEQIHRFELIKKHE